ncbi:hypothetical protein NLI96_g11403 [Meripilus lineatus]|uniref:Uncharacterized protein n=1 Tax=Meripilus lineatus TaxID=2056292 RepID=A0AAD5URU1_9APHY|nr:hypothetical protein NLI96_g11403 [Physisporinus lineatus]
MPRAGQQDTNQLADKLIAAIRDGDPAILVGLTDRFEDVFQSLDRFNEVDYCCVDEGRLLSMIHSAYRLGKVDPNVVKSLVILESLLSDSRILDALRDNFGSEYAGPKTDILHMMEGCSVLPDTGSDAGPLRLPEVLPPRIRRVPRRAQAQEPSELSQLEVPQTEVHTSDKEVATPSRSKGCAKQFCSFVTMALYAMAVAAVFAYLLVF